MSLGDAMNDPHARAQALARSLDAGDKRALRRVALTKHSCEPRWPDHDRCVELGLLSVTGPADSLVATTPLGAAVLALVDREAPSAPEPAPVAPCGAACEAAGHVRCMHCHAPGSKCCAVCALDFIKHARGYYRHNQHAREWLDSVLSLLKTGEWDLNLPEDRTRDGIGELLDLGADEDEQTAEDAEAELRAGGVDVDGFLERMHARVAEAKAKTPKPPPSNAAPSTCTRCKGAKQHGPWGDSDHDDDTLRPCNWCKQTGVEPAAAPSQAPHPRPMVNGMRQCQDCKAWSIVDDCEPHVCAVSPQHAPVRELVVTIHVHPCPDHDRCVEAFTAIPATRTCGSDVLDVLSHTRGAVYHALGDRRSTPEAVSFKCEAST